MNTLMVLTHTKAFKGSLMKTEDFAPTPENMTALFNSMNLLVQGITRQLTKDQRAGLTSFLASMARMAESRGDTATETLLIDLHQSSQMWDR